MSLGPVLLLRAPITGRGDGVATAHRDDCDRHGCLLCSAIRDAVAATVAGLRTLRLDALERYGWASTDLV